MAYSRSITIISTRLPSEYIFVQCSTTNQQMSPFVTCGFNNQSRLRIKPDEKSSAILKMSCFAKPIAEVSYTPASLDYHCGNTA